MMKHAATFEKADHIKGTHVKRWESACHIMEEGIMCYVREHGILYGEWHYMLSHSLGEIIP